MVSPYNSGGRESGGFRVHKGNGEIKYSLPLDSEAGTGVKPLHYPTPEITTDRKTSHVRPGWTPGFHA